MKRKRCEIKEKEALEAILAEGRVGRMATTGADGYPYITPVNYVYHDGSIYFHCAPAGEKIDNLKRDPRVCFEVDIPLAYLDLDYYGENPEGCGVTQFYQSVIIRGRAEIVVDLDEKVAALNRLVASHEKPGRPFQPIDADTRAVHLCEVVAVRIERISGKQELAQNKSQDEKRKLSIYLQDRGLPGDGEAARLIGGGSW
jgi:uncharacterized protein